MFERLRNEFSDFKFSFSLFVLLIFALLLIIAFVNWFVSQEKYIYFWDYATYYDIYADLAEKFLHKPFKALDSINVSMRKAEYNNVGVIALLPFYYLFGASRLVYITAIAVVYGFSTVAFFPALLKKITRFEVDSASINKALFLAVGMIALGFLPQFWIPILQGYIDAAGVGVIFLILYLYFQRNLAEQSLKRLIGLGLLIFLLVILRRWYAYWTVGFFAAMFAEITLSFFADKKDFGQLKLALRNVLIIGATAVCAFFALATQIAVQMLVTDYRDIYSAYRFSAGIYDDFEKLSDYFGLAFILACLAGFAVMWRRREMRRSAVFLTVLFAVTFYLFTRTQDIYFQHYYWVISVLIIFASVFVIEIYRKFEKRLSKIAFLLILTIMAAANFSIVFFKSSAEFLSPLSFALPKVRIAPNVRGDFEEIHRLLKNLNDLTENSDRKIYVLSSSVVFNSGVLINGSQIFEDDLRPLKERFLMTHDVDKRDGFPFDLYRADYVVVADPPGYHLDPKDQKVVGVLAEQILKRQTIGAAYVKMPVEYVLDDGSRVYIFHCERKFTAAELTEISRMFTEFYPNGADKFAISPEMIEEFSENR